MNKCLLWLSWASMFASPLIARSQDAILPPPKPPFVKTLPAVCSWTVKFTQSDVSGNSGSASGASHAPFILRITEIQGTKRDPERREMLSWNNSKTTEIWLYHGFILADSPLSSDISVQPVVIGAPSAYVRGFGTTDFPELDWLSLENYTETQFYSGRMCYVYELKGSNSGEARKAFIDGETLLPVTVIRGKETRSYEFENTAGSLALPSVFGDAFTRYQAKMKELERHRMPKKQAVR